MENLMLYFIKANGLIILFYLMYVLFLRKETFFVSNRLYLILGLLISLSLPLITFTKTIWIEPTPVPEFYQETTTVNSDYIEVPIQETPIDWSLILTTAYVVICVLILVKIGIEIASFYNRIRKHNQQKEADFTLIHSNTTENPFSFFHYIVINPHLFSEAELQHILTHESIHVKQKHSIDVLLGKLFCAVFWVNPIIWLYRKAMLQNLEFIADSETFQQIENKYEYQITLLKVVTHQHDLSITNQFYQSLIKKRIVMLHTNQSHKRNAWKYATILPLLLGFMLLFQIETVAQVKESKIEETNYAVSTNYSSILTKNTTDKELRELEKSFSDEKYKLKISKVKRNKNGEIIEIKLLFDSGKTYVEILERKSTEPIDAIKIFIKSDKNDNVTCGFEEISNVVSAKYLEDDENGAIKMDSEGYTVDNMVKNGKKVNLIINGKLQSATVKSKIPLDQEIDVMKELNASDLKSKYNIDKKEGEIYYELTTKKEVVIKEESKAASTGWGISFETETSNSENLIEDIKEDTKIDYQKALIILDGNEIVASELDKINPNKISSMSNFTTSKKLIEKYGEKAKYGVIIIESNEYHKRNNPIIIDEKTNVDFRLNGDNDGFVISKNSQISDLEFYKSILIKNNIAFEFNNLERNEKNQITSITIQLSENGKIEKKILKSNNVIPKIFIGKRNGKLTITETK
ncbi:M56 family metallopeptidase [Flavobacterium sp.]|jgi:beta-lactamase regulating signal transducer with metallopeptidase domain|uniref:M56 family metallopeptidase n=1 Tax=Flavobacterium sp. TaxID=239 RepID=UPI0037BF6DF1